MEHIAHACTNGKYENFTGTISWGKTSGAVEDATFTLINDGGNLNLVWYKGTWINGTWQKGTWKSGIWKRGTWLNGTWERGTWLRGTWNDGTWLFGFWNGGTFKNGTWHDGIFRNGSFKRGDWLNGFFHDGSFWYGTWHDGIYTKNSIFHYAKGNLSIYTNYERERGMGYYDFGACTSIYIYGIKYTLGETLIDDITSCAWSQYPINFSNADHCKELDEIRQYIQKRKVALAQLKSIKDEIEKAKQEIKAKYADVFKNLNLNEKEINEIFK